MYRKLRGVGRVLALTGLSAATAVALIFATPARAWVGYSFGFAPAPYYAPPAYPYYYPAPPYYAPPPVYAPPPPYSYNPPPQEQGGYPQSCYAGRYVCPMVRAVPAGSRCWCPDNAGGRAYGAAS